jgi:hypothetical protein
MFLPRRELAIRRPRFGRVVGFACCVLALGCQQRSPSEAQPIVTTSTTTTPAALDTPAGAPQSLVVEYADGARIPVSEWQFHYQFVESDDPPGSLFFYQYKDLRDLLVTVRSVQERGVTLNDERRIPAAELESIRINWSPRPDLGKGAHSRTSIDVALRNGERLHVASGGLAPAKKLLTSRKYFYGGGVCPAST